MRGSAHDARGAVLLALARETLELRLNSSVAWPDDSDAVSRDAWLLDPGATFVTLEKHGALRGCIGSLEPRRRLIDDVRHNALAAALEDTRFEPVAADELADLSIEVTLLGPREPLVIRDERDALDRLRPHVDGVVLTFRGRRATFLPQVWEDLATPATFLAALKEKAGLDRGFWHPSIALERYTVSSWCESD